jgi:translation initiation factor 1
MSKHKIPLNGLVYSTDPSFQQQEEPNEEIETLAPASQNLRIKLDTKQRAGKVVTIIEGFKGTLNDLEILGKLLKTKCGTGGSVKDGVIIIQGDVKQKVMGILQDLNYKVK